MYGHPTQHKIKTSQQGIALVACRFALSEDEIQLTPAGFFSAKDGRPHDAGQWFINDETAAKILAKLRSRKDKFVIDYEHQTLNAEKNGQPAPAAGWIDPSQIEWRSGQGFFAKPKWTVTAKAHIESKEYQYFSPVMLYNKRTGEVTDIVMGAVTNYAAIDGMAGLVPDKSSAFSPSLDITGLASDIDNLQAQAAATFLFRHHSAPGSDDIPSVPRHTGNCSCVSSIPSVPRHKPNQEENPMDEKIRALLGLAKDASDDQVTAALTAVIDKNKASEQAIAAAKAETPDDALATIQSMQTELVALKAQVNDREVEELVSAALKSGQLLQAQKEWAMNLGKSNVQSLKDYIDASPGIAALKNTQTSGKEPDGLNAENDLDETALAVCKSMGVDPEAYKKTLAENN